MSTPHQKAVAKYNAATYEKITLRLKKDDAKNLRAYLDGRSLNGFISAAISEKVEREKSHGAT